MTRDPVALMTAVMCLCLGLTIAHAENPMTDQTPISCHSVPEISEEMTGHLAGICDSLSQLEAITSLEGDLHVTLVAEDIGPDRMRAHLAWASGTETGQGPSVDFGFMDHPLGPQQYDFVATSLANATNFPRSDTNAP